MSFVQSPSLLYVFLFCILALRPFVRTIVPRVAVSSPKISRFLPIFPPSEHFTSVSRLICAISTLSLSNNIHTCIHTHIYIYIWNVNKQIGNTNKQTGIVNKQRRGRGRCKQTNLNRTNKSDFHGITHPFAIFAVLLANILMLLQVSGIWAGRGRNRRRKKREMKRVIAEEVSMGIIGDFFRVFHRERSGATRQSSRDPEGRQLHGFTIDFPAK